MSPLLRRLARDQWVRVHGTPRITVLVGPEPLAAWRAWIGLADLEDHALFDAPLERAVREAYDLAVAAPQRPVAIAADPDELARWRRDRRDRLAALVDEGLLLAEPAPEPARDQSGAHAAAAPARAPAHWDARSAAEAAMFEALEATPATAGRFRLNESLSVHFGDRAAEIDLLSRIDRIAIEIDGYHHFQDADAYRRDRRKDLLLQTQGLLVLRFLAEDVIRDARLAVHAVVQALAYRQGEGA